MPSKDIRNLQPGASYLVQVVPKNYDGSKPIASLVKTISVPTTWGGSVITGNNTVVTNYLYSSGAFVSGSTGGPSSPSSTMFIDGTGLKSFNASGVNTVLISSQDGTAYFSGSVRVGNSSSTVALVPNPSVGGIAIYAGNDTPSSAPFYVTNTGSLVATSASISGNITASVGTIGGFTIGASTLYAGTSASIVGISTTSNSFFAGATASTGAGAKFLVNNNGNLNATSASITGQIVATSGSITGNLIIDGGVIQTIDSTFVSKTTLEASASTATDLKFYPRHIPISSILRSSTTVSITTSIPHELGTGVFVKIYGTDATDKNIEGVFEITQIVDSDTFRYETSTSGAVLGTSGFVATEYHGTGDARLGFGYIGVGTKEYITGGTPPSTGYPKFATLDIYSPRSFIGTTSTSTRSYIRLSSAFAEPTSETGELGSTIDIVAARTNLGKVDGTGTTRVYNGFWVDGTTQLQSTLSVSASAKFLNNVKISGELQLIQGWNSFPSGWYDTDFDAGSDVWYRVNGNIVELRGKFVRDTGTLVDNETMATLGAALQPADPQRLSAALDGSPWSGRLQIGIAGAMTVRTNSSTATTVYVDGIIYYLDNLNIT